MQSPGSKPPDSRRKPGSPYGLAAAEISGVVDVVVPPPLGWVVVVVEEVVAAVDAVVLVPDPFVPDVPAPLDLDFAFAFGTVVVVVVVPLEVPAGAGPMICSACWSACSIAAMSA